MKESRIKGKTALITGATSGIGKACAEQLAMHGAHVIITGRRLERLEKLAEKLSEEYGVKAYPIKLDIQKGEEVERLQNECPAEVDILINNAGLALSTEKLQDGDPANWDIVIDTNIKGLLYMIRAFLPSMVKRNEGHIVNIGSIAGRECYISGNVYSATKFAVKGLNKSLRLDLLGTAIRVTEIAPGAVETEFSEVRWNDKERAKQFYQGFQPLVADDIADAVLYSVTRPPHVNIEEMVVYPQAQASVGYTFREGDSIKGPMK